MESIINVTELSRRLGVSHPAVSRAKNKGGKVKGIDLRDIAVYKANKIVGFSLDKLQQIQNAMDEYESARAELPSRKYPADGSSEPRQNPGQPEYRENPRRNNSFLNIESVSMADLAQTVPSLAGMSPRVSIPIFTCSAAVAGGLLMYYATQQRPDIQPQAVAAGAAIGGLTYAGSLYMAARFSKSDQEKVNVADDGAKAPELNAAHLDESSPNLSDNSSKDDAKIKPFKLKPLSLSQIRDRASNTQ